MHGAGHGVDLELDADARQRQRMTQRDQLGGALGRLDRGDARDADHVTLARLARRNQFERGRLHANAAARPRHTMGFGLGRDVHHVGLPVRVEMGQRVVASSHDEGRVESVNKRLTPWCDHRRPEPQGPMRLQRRMAPSATLR